MKRYGLIGKKLSHSFSKRYFTNKFDKENIQNCEYTLYELPNIEKVREIFEINGLIGFNVTVPYKLEIINELTDLDESANKVGAVNVVKLIGNKRIGYNSDYIGFKESLNGWLPNNFDKKALILGTGGASRAVEAVLSDLNINFVLVSRNSVDKAISYQQAESYLINGYQLIINTTPVGMSPNIDEHPPLKLDNIDSSFYLYDLIYNPDETIFLRNGKIKGASVKNGLDMLYLQAEASWEIWNK